MKRSKLHQHSGVAVTGGIACFKLMVGFALLLGASGSLIAAEYPEWQTEPLYGTLNLHDYPGRWVALVPMRAGGSLRMPSSAGEECAGYVEGDQPDLDLNVRTGNELTMSVTARSPEPVFLVMYTSEEVWMCAPHGKHEDTTLVVPRATRGNYNLWLGTPDSSDEFPTADVLIQTRQLMTPAVWNGQ